MDISKFNTVQACEEGVWVDISDPEGNKTDVRIKVVGVDSKTYKNESHKLAKYLERIKDDKSKDYDEIELKTRAMAVAITMDWENLEEEGKKLPFNKETADRIYELAPGIPEQIIKVAKDRANFLSKKQKD
jgi:hypothetical protein